METEKAHPYSTKRSGDSDTNRTKVEVYQEEGSGQPC